MSTHNDYFPSSCFSCLFIQKQTIHDHIVVMFLNGWNNISTKFHFSTHKMRKWSQSRTLSPCSPLWKEFNVFYQSPALSMEFHDEDNSPLDVFIVFLVKRVKKIQDITLKTRDIIQRIHVAWLLLTRIAPNQKSERATDGCWPIPLPLFWPMSAEWTSGTVITGTE